MGVSGFAGFLRRRYPGAYRVLSEDEVVCDNLYIDLASTLHQTLRKARTRAYFHFLLHKRLDAILATCKPRKRVVIAMDGPAPLAKLLEQRRRRRREAGRQLRSGVSGRGRGDASQQQQQQPSSLSALMLTTGTPLMLEMHQSLAYYICKRLADPETEHLQFELSDSTVKGEGELKILQRLLEGAGSSNDPGTLPESHMVLGGDSDLLLMAMVSGRERVFICDDSQDFIADVAAEEVEAGAGEAAGVPVADVGSPAAASSLASDGNGSSLGAAAEASGRVGTAAAAAGGASDRSSSSSGGNAGSSGPKGSGRRRPGGGGHKWGRAPTGSWQAQEGSRRGLHVFSGDQLAELWRQEHLTSSSASSSSREVLGMSLDLALLAIMCGGNDYLPGMQGLQMVCKHRPGLWNLYLEMRGEPEWKGRRLVQRRGSAHKPYARVNTPVLAELLQRYHDRRAQVVPPDLVLSTSSEEESSSEEDDIIDDEQLLEGLLEDREGEGGGPAAKQRLRRALVRLRSRLEPPRLASADGEAAALIEAGGGGEKRRTRGWARLSEAGISRHRGCGPGCMCDEYCSPRSRKQHSTRGEADATAYIKGLEWVLGMYMRGHVSDYRFTYDMSAPPLLDLLDHLWVKADSNSAQALRAAVAGAAGRYTAAELWGMSEGEEEGRFEGYGSAGELSEEEEEGEAGLGSALAAGQEAAAAAAGVVGPGRAAAASSGPQRRQPLLPAACALALLPRGGRSHAPTALQHLMDDNSPLADIYAVCDTCTDLGRQMGVVSRDLHHVRRELLTLRRLLGRVLAVLDESYLDKEGAAAAGGAGAAGEGLARSAAAAAEPDVPLAPEELMGFSLEHEVVRIQAAINARYEAEASLKSTMAALSRVQQDHYAEQHPYKPFPTAELEAAVAAVPVSKHPWRERRLLRFGRDLLFRRGDAGESANSSMPAAAAAAVGSSGSSAAAAEAAPEAEPWPRARVSEQWQLECAAFASAYHRFVDRSLFRNPRAQGILRETLPMHREPLRYTMGSGTGGRPSGGGGGIRHSSSGSRNGGGGSRNGSGGAGGGFRSSGGGGGSKAKPAASSSGKAQPYSSTAPMAALQVGAARLSSKALGLPNPSPPLAALHLRLRPQYSNPVSPGGVQQLLRQCSRLLPGLGTRRLLSCLR